MRRYWVYRAVDGKFIGALCIEPYRAEKIRQNGFVLMPVV
jgi:hypothetical protein